MINSAKEAREIVNQVNGWISDQAQRDARSMLAALQWPEVTALIPYLHHMSWPKNKRCDRLDGKKCSCGVDQALSLYREAVGGKA